jgi:hypothetical protein
MNQQYLSFLSEPNVFLRVLFLNSLQCFEVVCDLRVAANIIATDLGGFSVPHPKKQNGDFFRQLHFSLFKLSRFF